MPYSSGISVLICTYNGASRLVPTLEHLAQQASSLHVPWEVILVDNNSTDDTAVISGEHWERLGAPAPLILLSQPKAGKQFALELAYNTAQYEFMCIVDDDNWLHKEYLQKGYAILQMQPAIGLLGGSNVGAFEISTPHWFPSFQAAYAVGKPVVYLPEGKRTLVSGEVVIGVLWGAGLFVRRIIWQKLQEKRFESLFTGRQGAKQLTAGEDDELCCVSRLLGYKLWYDEGLQCTHYMTAGRLTEDYLKRLCYASSRAYPGMSAYQRILSPDGTKYTALLPWVKDWLYMLLWALRDLLSLKYIKSYFKPDLETQIAVNQRVLTWYQFTINFKLARENFRKVAKFRSNI
jgi:glycosyltransferase involved in cell wall biosynthesis